MTRPYAVHFEFFNCGLRACAGEQTWRGHAYTARDAITQAKTDVLARGYKLKGSTGIVGTIRWVAPDIDGVGRGYSTQG